ncbi:putative Serine/threonine-protein kinase bud32 [Sporormia fimetaria CBS 119925]|uniref:EKC/KEOPS complex subunit BUD32 n=1 Tax=Sporormia fimetaria CBS 119925 TaxID=1340428 RepID=A0A6A6V6M4_9PLEO|nr:putative Serine/threonine-protein kinase bud32 [Sporormia fimetaria CBS 119925]
MADNPPREGQPDSTTHILPAPFTTSSLTPMTQGAEALVYKTVFLTPTTPCILKYRPPKPYRHPILDRRLTKARLLAEARVLVRARKEGVPVPAVLGGDWDAGWLALEFIEGRTVRAVLDAWVEGWKNRSREGESVEGEAEMKEFMHRIGHAVGRLHECGIVHGDLTTSNLMVRPSATSHSTSSGVLEQGELDGEIVLIDFGLAVQSTRQTQEEDRAVDLYVLERAFAATHPWAEKMFKEVLEAYKKSYKGAGGSLKKLEGVRLRGRKRSMLG